MKGSLSSRFLGGAWLVLAVLAVCLPMLWIFLASLKSQADQSDPFGLVFVPTFENWAEVLGSDLLGAIGRSLVLGVVVVLISMLVGIPGAYSIALFKIGGNSSRIAMLIAQVLPPAVLVFPFLSLAYMMRINGTMLALIPAHVGFVLPVVVWFMLSFFSSVPMSLEEQARIDGLTRFQAFLKVILPLVLPGLGAAAIFGFSLSWNDMFYAQILVAGGQQTLPLAIADYNTFRGINLGPMSAAILMSSLPILVLTFFIQKRLIQGLGGHGVKY